MSPDDERPGSGLRPATARDAALVARLSDMADEELPRLIWAREVTADKDIWAVGTESYARLLAGACRGGCCCRTPVRRRPAGSGPTR